MASSKTSSLFPSSLFLLLLIAALAISYQYLSTHHAQIEAMLGGKRARQYESFDAFYKGMYRKEHSDDKNRYLHFIGTTIALASAAAEPTLFLAALAAVVVGLNVFELTYMRSNGAIEGAAMLLAYLSLAYIPRRSLRRPLLTILCGYACAWVGHFVIEGNRPATFTYAVFSFIGDFRMWWETVGELGNKFINIK